ncbi:MAG: RHS repeat-associated core domain-containing protein, partial [Candidatus Acidiferrales bacterium]
VLRTTTNTLLSTSAYTNLNIVNRVTEKTMADSTGTNHFLQNTTYDGTTISPCPTGAAQHDDTNYGCSFTTRGNPTSVTIYTNASAPSGAITKNSYYDVFGNLVQADLDCCESKSWSYAATTQYGYPASDTCGATGGPQVTTSYTYNTYTGQMATKVDPNNQTWSYAYDTMRRPTTTTRPDQTQITTSYQDSQHTVTRTTPTQAGNARDGVHLRDGITREVTLTVQNGSGTTYSNAARQYDPLGRQYRSSDPYVTGSGQYWITTQYDALGRETKRVWQDGSQTTSSYATNTVTVTDPVGHQRKYQNDGLGRLSTIYEPDPTNNNSLTLQTTTSYTVLDRSSQITQGAQTRTFNYDDAGRLTSEATPEAGTWSYQYNNYNRRIQRTDARGVITTYSYDTMSRPYQISYNVGTTGVPATPTVTYNFGTSATQFNNGLLLTVTDGVGSETYTYDNLGRKTQEQQVINGNTYTIGYQHELDNKITSVTYPSTRVIQTTYDSIGRFSGLSNGLTIYAGSVTYGATSQITGFKYGNGITATIGYSPDRLQYTSLSFTGSTTPYSVTYGYAQNGGNNGEITTISDSVDSGRSTTFTYDALDRLSTASTSGSTNYPAWGLSFTYDRYGNRTAQTVTAGTAPSESVSVSATTNHLTTTGFTYDANGNMTNDGVNVLIYDGENRAVSDADGGGTATYSYNASGQRAVKTYSGTTTTYVFSRNQAVSEYANGSLNKEYVYLHRELLAEYDGGTLYYHISDHNSVRVTLDSNGNLVGQQGHFPFGEDWYETNVTTTRHYTTYERDAESANDYAMHRFFVNRLDRFSSPDPVKGRLKIPQSQDRYSYVQNEPVKRTDPSGLYACVCPPELPDCGCTCCSPDLQQCGDCIPGGGCDDGDDSGDCGDGGGEPPPPPPPTETDLPLKRSTCENTSNGYKGSCFFQADPSGCGANASFFNFGGKCINNSQGSNGRETTGCCKYIKVDQNCNPVTSGICSVSSK